MLLYKNKVAPEEWPYVAGLLGGLIAFCLMNMTDNRFASPEMGAVLGLWFGLMGTIGIKEKKLLPKGCGSIMGKQ